MLQDYTLRLHGLYAKILPARRTPNTESIEKWATPTFLIVITGVWSRQHDKE
jgi:hypothetical protein